MNIRNLNIGLTRVKFKNNHVVYENFVKCTIKDYEFNLSYNPTLLSSSQTPLYAYKASSGDNTLYEVSGSQYYGILKNFASRTYTTYELATSSGGGITSGGTNIGNQGDDEVTKNISIGFDFTFYDTAYSKINLSSNGNAQFTTNYSSFEPTELPYNDKNFGPSLFPFFSDLNLQTTYRADAGIYTQTIGSAGSRIFYAEWRGVWYSDTDKNVNFQIRLYETTNIIEFVYGVIENSNENDNFVIGFQKNYNDYNNFEQYYYGASIPEEGLVVSYTPQLGDSAFSPYVTTVGLYNDANELLAVGKMSSPIPISSNTDMTFLVKYDTQWIEKPYFTPSHTPTPTLSTTPSVTPTVTNTPSVTPTVTNTPSVTPTITPSSSVPATPSITPTVTNTPSITPSVTPSITPSKTPSITPSITPSATLPLGECFIVYNETSTDASVSFVNRSGVTSCEMVPANSFTYLCVKYGTGSQIYPYEGFGCTGGFATLVIQGLATTCSDAGVCY